mgnify:FL=1
MTVRAVHGQRKRQLFFVSQPCVKTESTVKSKLYIDCQYYLRLDVVTLVVVYCFNGILCSESMQDWCVFTQCEAVSSV